jgi:hypothetical protein
MNDLEAYFLNNPGRMIHKWMHYFEVYERHLSRFRGTDAHVVEIGVSQGGSLQMWRHYFGAQATIYGVDVSPAVRQFEEAGIRILIGDQADRAFLRGLAEQTPRIDILIDDGGHTMAQQRTTFEELFPRIDPFGVYICEDLHTSYWPAFGGGHLDPRSFIEFSKNHIDRMNAWHSGDPQSLPVSEFTRTAYAMHYYDSMLVIEKRPREPPTHRETGLRALPDSAFPPSPR